MRLLRLFVVSLLMVILAGCPSNDSGPWTHEVPDSECPPGWSGLEVETEREEEAEYLDDVPACQDTEARTYLVNRSDAVWVLPLSNPDNVIPFYDRPPLREMYFVNLVWTEWQKMVLVPGAEVVIELPQEDVEWVIDLPLSLAWEGHDLVFDRLEAAGLATVADQLGRRSPAGAALVACTQAVVQAAEAEPSLEDVDVAKIVLDAVGISATSSACAVKTREVILNRSGSAVTLADDLTLLRTQSAMLSEINSRMSYAQRASRILQQALRFVPR